MTVESIAPPELDMPAPLNTPAVDDLRGLAREVVGHLVDSAAPCRTTADTDLTVVVRTCLQWAIQRWNGAVLPDRIAALDAAAARWAREEIPIGTVQHAIHAGFAFALDRMFTAPGQAGRVDVRAGTTSVLEVLHLATAAVSRAYVRACKVTAVEHHTSVHTLTSALLGGHATSAMARQCGIPLADEYFVLALAVPEHPDENRPHLDRQVVARRKLRRLQAALASLFGARALSLLSVDGGTILVPCTETTAADLDDVVRTLADAARVPVTAAVASAVPDEVSAAAVRAHELLDTVEQLSLGPGLHRFTELALHYQLTRSGVGREALCGRLAPLFEYPHLLETLQVHISTDLNRQRTARQLHIHPNTIDYRLRRITQLTGLDPSDAKGLWYLRSALVAWTAGGRRGYTMQAAAPE
ncbi:MULTISPECIES: PucR family transcriptional regulator [Nocardia]|uniref:PucR family transcriptional regulator n=1 Tax=Nocardia TaxID=1817 RepID=UPI001F0E3C1F|nr:MULTISPECIES: helix-turn-helix domain-containing protein [Nocardia]